MSDEQQPSELEVRLAIIAELRGALRSAVAVLDWAAIRMRTAQSDTERDQVGAEIEGFLRRTILGVMALGVPGWSGDGSSVIKEK